GGRGTRARHDGGASAPLQASGPHPGRRRAPTHADGKAAAEAAARRARELDEGGDDRLDHGRARGRERTLELRRELVRGRRARGGYAHTLRNLHEADVRAMEIEHLARLRPARAGADAAQLEV